jgi:hypothetical protein
MVTIDIKLSMMAFHSANFEKGFLLQHLSHQHYGDITRNPSSKFILKFSAVSPSADFFCSKMIWISSRQSLGLHHQLRQKLKDCFEKPF